MHKKIMTVWALGLVAAAGLSACPDDSAEPTTPGADAVADATTDATSDATADGTADAGPDVAQGPIVDITPVIPQCDLPTPISRTYSATIRYTSYGVPHIEGTDIGDIGFGQAYAMARDHICTMADQYVKAASERSKYFGPGDNDRNIVSDLGWSAVGLREKATCVLNEVSQDARQAMAGFVAGYNKYLEDTGVENLPAMCANADWVRPITELDLQSQLLMLVLRASADALIGTVVAAAPPGSKGDGPNDAGPSPYGPVDLPDFRNIMGDLGSNGWALGSERTDNGRGKLIANPHFPWEGALRLHESQLTIPGELNVHGVALIGVPGVLIGFNEHLGWTHTVSSSQRFTMYRVALDSSDPTVYLYDGERRRMSSKTVSIEVKQPDGTLDTVEQTFYATHHGPVIDASPLSWTSTAAFGYRDANYENAVFIDQFFAMNRATNIEEFKDAYRDFNGIPWVNTMYTDKEGNAFYVDSTPVPRLSPEALAWHQDAITGNVDPTDGAALLAGLVYFNFGAYLFDGSRSDHDWTVATGAEGLRSDGVTPFSEAPQATRTDYIFNANDSHWLTHLTEPLEGFSPLYGLERTTRSPRTRMNVRLITEVAADGVSGADGKFDFEELKAVRTTNRAFLFEEWQGAVVTRCGGGATVAVGDDTVDLTEACSILAAWDGRLNLTSVGAPIMREFAAYWRETNDSDEAAIFATPFDANDPLGTPAGLPAAPATGDDPVLVTLGRAVLALQDAGVALDAPFSDAQFTKKGDDIIPIPGGNGIEGAFNIVTYSSDRTTLLPKIPRGAVVHGSTDLTDEGYLINYGTSFVMALEFTDDGPNANCLLTYSQSMDPTSPHFSDQTQLFGQDSWRPILFTEADLVADPGLTTVTVSSE